MKNILLIIVMLISNGILSQTTEKELVDNFINKNPYFNNYQEELFFLHTNKETYFSGEDIWFAAYIYDKLNEKPSEITKNLHLNLYDFNFKLIDQKLFYVKEGKAAGQLKLLENLSSGTYYIEMDTNWNRNFKKGTISEITIINLNNQLDSSKKVSKPAETKSKKIDTKTEQNFLIHRNVEDINTANFKIKSISDVIDKLKGNTIYAVLHKNDILAACASIKITDKKYYNLKFNSESFLNGANTISIFDENNIILAQSTFWNFETKTGSVGVLSKEKKRDTLYIRLDHSKNLLNPNLSVSILNAKSELISDVPNILNSFIDSDFTKINKTKDYKEINNLLTDRKINLNKTTRQIIYENEAGTKLKGKVNTKTEVLEDFKVSLISEENELFLVTNLNKDMSFEFDDLYLNHPTKYKLALLNSQGEIENASFYIYNNFYNYEATNFLEVEKETNNIKPLENNIFKNNIILKPEKEVVKLKEVILNSHVDKQKNIREKYKNIIGVGFTDFYIPDDNLAVGVDIFFYLQTIPGLRVYYPPLSSAPIVLNTRGPSSITGTKLVNVKLDGVPMGEDLLPLTGFLTTDFEVIMVNLSGAGEGLRGSNGVVNLITRIDNDYLSKKHPMKTAKPKETLKGFEISLENYKKPNLMFDDSWLEEAYGTIDWIPNLKTDINNEFLLKIPVSTDQKDIKLIINGFDKYGILIHETIKISTN
ncbi:hypothetical protein [Polaribacter glomeratus]|nr:hypothetical protein [Polaribacter glomeratus]TXD66389.1 hypothetical protein ESX12_06290 [Polaribacter glomeratus]